jgi:MarR family transcriptional regulator, transcriptional regulator for hemolysin
VDQVVTGIDGPTTRGRLQQIDTHALLTTGRHRRRAAVGAAREPEPVP